jgi:hypothetical protein
MRNIVSNPCSDRADLRSAVWIDRRPRLALYFGALPVRAIGIVTFLLSPFTGLHRNSYRLVYSLSGPERHQKRLSTGLSLRKCSLG